MSCAASHPNCSPGWQETACRIPTATPITPMKHGKIERWHRILKDLILLNNYFLPDDLEWQTVRPTDTRTGTSDFGAVPEELKRTTQSVII
jgi:hypothetical protein